MRLLVLITALFFPLGSFASDLQQILEGMRRKPDLNPQLTTDEVDRAFEDWLVRMNPVIDSASKMEERLLTELTRDHDTLAPRLKGTKKIVLYSLYPLPRENLHSQDSRSTELRKLPAFHGYPVFGTIVIDDADAVKRWSHFFQDSIMCGSGFLCAFEPRHGFRFYRKEGFIDILMCFHCSQLAFYGKPNLAPNTNPVFSNAVRDTINVLFQKHKIEQDAELVAPKK